MNISATMIPRGAMGILLAAFMVAAADTASLPSNFPNQEGRVKRSLPDLEEEAEQPQAWFSFSGTHTMGMMDSGLFFAKDQGMVKDHR